MLKEQLRKEALSKRRESFSYTHSLIICKKVANLPDFKNAKTVMLYLSSKSEVDTSYIIAEATKQGKVLCAPRVLNDRDMEAVILNSSNLKKGAFGIWEPIGHPISNIDLIIVPGVVFDKNKNRIGYGKGYYDRFLNNSKARTIGLAFSCQIVQDIPAMPHDKKLDMIITEEGIIQ